MQRMEEAHVEREGQGRRETSSNDRNPGSSQTWSSHSLWTQHERSRWPQAGKRQPENADGGAPAAKSQISPGTDIHQSTARCQADRWTRRSQDSGQSKADTRPKSPISTLEPDSNHKWKGPATSASARVYNCRPHFPQVADSCFPPARAWEFCPGAIAQ